MSHAPDCDLVEYGGVPGATGVKCTCDAGDAEPDGDGEDGDDGTFTPPMRRTAPATSVAAARVYLSGAAATALVELREAERALRAAQARRDAAISALMIAVVE